MDTSVSAIETFDGCPLKWAYGYVHGIWAAKNQSASDGIDVHQHLENYSRYGQKFEDSTLGNLAKLALPYLPDPSDEPLIEADLRLDYAGHTFKMSADAAWNSPAGAILNDYKSVKNYRFCLTSVSLRSNLQASVYALKLIQKFEVPEVNLRWIYLRRPPNEAHVPGPEDIKVVEAVVDEDDARCVVRSKLPSIEKMDAIKRVKLPIAEITRNEDHCSAYGGCGYRGHCFPGKFDLATGKKLD